MPVDIAHAGDIICIAGLAKASVADTIGAPGLDAPVASLIDPPTMSVTIMVNQLWRA